MSTVPCGARGNPLLSCRRSGVSFGPHRLPVAANGRFPQGGGLRCCKVMPLPADARTKYEQLFEQLDTSFETPKPCRICRSSSPRRWVCGACHHRCKHADEEVANGWIRRSNETRQAWQRCLRCGTCPHLLPRPAVIYGVCMTGLSDDRVRGGDRAETTQADAICSFDHVHLAGLRSYGRFREALDTS